MCGSNDARSSSFIIHHSAFTLIEVMVALLIFFMAVFTILGLLSNALRNARALQRKQTDCSMMAARMTITNRLYEGPLPSEVIAEFEDSYPDYTGDGEVGEESTNGLFRADMIVLRRSGNAPVESELKILLFRPESPPGSLSRGTLR